MNCTEFRKNIPDIIHKQIEIENMEEIVKHVESCKDCYDELEINYILNNGLSDEAKDEHMDFIAHLKTDLQSMSRAAKRYRNVYAIMIFIRISAYAAILGSLVYVIFKIWMVE